MQIRCTSGVVAKVSSTALPGAEIFVEVFWSWRVLFDRLPPVRLPYAARCSGFSLTVLISAFAERFLSGDEAQESRQGGGAGVRQSFPCHDSCPPQLNRSQFKKSLRTGEASSKRQTDGQRFQKKAYENTKFII